VCFLLAYAIDRIQLVDSSNEYIALVEDIVKKDIPKHSLSANLVGIIAFANVFAILDY